MRHTDKEEALEQYSSQIATMMAIVLLVSYALVMALATPLLSEKARVILSKEGGVIETATAAVLWAWIIWIVIDRWFRPEWWRAALVALFCLAAREMDWHKHFTTESILKPKFYVMAEAGVIERLIGISILCILIWAVVTLARHLPKYLKSLNKPYFWVHGFWLFVAIGVTAKAMDSGERLFPFWQEWLHERDLIFVWFEESLELLSALVLGLVLFDRRRYGFHISNN